MFEMPGERLTELADAESRLQRIKEAYDEYLLALANREHGGVAASHLVSDVAANLKGW